MASGQMKRMSVFRERKATVVNHQSTPCSSRATMLVKMTMEGLFEPSPSARYIPLVSASEALKATVAEAQLPSAEDHFAKNLSPKEVEESCTIRVEIERTKRIGRMQHDEPKIYDEKPHLASIIPDDSKPAAYGLSTK